MQKSRKLRLIIFCLLIGCFSCSDNSEQTVVARVNGEAVTAEEFLPRYKDFLNSTGISDDLRQRDQILNNIINEYIIAHHIDTSKYRDNSYLHSLLKYHRKKVLIAAWKKTEIKDKVSVNDADLREAFYRLNTKLRVRHLYARNRQAADSIYQLVQEGRTFEELARDIFNDQHLAASGGDLGYFAAGDMDPAFEDVAYNLTQGEVSPPVQTGDGFSIIKVEDRQRTPIITETQFLEKKKFLKRHLHRKRIELAERAEINRLVEDANIVYDPNGLEILWQAMQLIHNSPAVDDTLFTNIAEQPALADSTHPCLKFGEGTTWDVAKALSELGQVKPKFINKIRDKFSLQLTLQGLVTRELLYQQAEAGNYEKLPGQPLKLAAEARFAKTYFFKDVITDVTMNSIAETEMREFYELNKSQFRGEETVKIQILAMNDSLDIERMKQRVLAGANFTDLVNAHSVLGGIQMVDGFTDWLPRRVLGPIADQIFAMKPGEIAGPFKDDDTFWIIRFHDRREGMQQPFEMVKNAVITELISSKREEVFRLTVNKLRKESVIEKDMEVLKNLALLSDTETKN